MPRKTETLGDLERFRASMSANAAELPNLDATRITFEGLIAKAQALTQQQAALTASKQEVTQELQTVLADVQRLGTVLRLAVRQHYGIRAEKLAEFGLQPFRGRKRKAKEPEAPPPVELKTAPPAAD